ncbi:hypothetical protein M0208_06165 [Sphingomonas sp. SUN019]|nr:hypothetical protein [Sphingomonas sp. SUN019]UVO50122.1 hypothetical protein M0208_06165 [Sphingomonas sp. SUN019]
MAQLVSIRDKPGNGHRVAEPYDHDRYVVLVTNLDVARQAEFSLPDLRTHDVARCYYCGGPHAIEIGAFNTVLIGNDVTALM